MSDPLVKINHLLALAGSDNPHEASTAALAAVRMMKKYGVRLTLSGQAAPPPPPPKPKPEPPPRPAPAPKKEKKEKKAAPPPAPPAPPPPQSSYTYEKVYDFWGSKHDPEDGPTFIRSVFPGVCCSCNGAFYVDSHVVGIPGKGCVHPRCRKGWEPFMEYMRRGYVDPCANEERWNP
jgi:hypothetical protein